MTSIKRFLLRMLKSGRVFDEMAVSRWRSDKLLILCYHGVSLEDEHEWKPSFSMPLQAFEDRLKLLRDYSVLPLEEALQRLYSNTLPRKSVVLTFDDGMHNFYAQAFPVLKQYQYPVTLYLTTYYCTHNLPVFSLVTSYMLWKSRHQQISPHSDIGLNQAIDLSTEAKRLQAWGQIQQHAEKNGLNAKQKNELAKQLARHLNVDFDHIDSKRLCHLMTPEQIREIAQNGVDIQLHTHRHRSPMDRVLFQREIDENRTSIEQLTGHSAKHHCYPSGVYKPPFLPWLSEQKVVSATTCDPGFARVNTNPLLLPRFLDASNVSPIEFESWLSGVGAWLPKNPFRGAKKVWTLN